MGPSDAQGRGRPARSQRSTEEGDSAAGHKGAALSCQITSIDGILQIIPLHQMYYALSLFATFLPIFPELVLNFVFFLLVYIFLLDKY